MIHELKTDPQPFEDVLSRRKPYEIRFNDIKPVHLAKLIHSTTGDVSPYCAETPRKLNLNKEKWTTDRKTVTCKKCKINRQGG